jgi:hypothetical protein
VEGVEAEVDEVERDSHLVWGFVRLYIECILVLGQRMCNVLTRLKSLDYTRSQG